MRKNIVRELAAYFVVISAILAGAIPAAAQGMGGFDMNQASQFLRYLPPMIKSVTQEPAEPQKGDPVKITAKVSRLHFGEDDYETVDSVALYYTVDGEKWEQIAMEESDDKLTWTAEIPSVDICTEVDYHITAKDSAGNIAMELPGWLALPGWSPAKEGDAPAKAHDFLTKIYDHVNSEKIGIPTDMILEPIPSYMDVKSVWFGYDDNNFYFRLQYGDPVQKGSVSPLDINLYMLAVINCSLDVIFTDAVMEGLNNGFKGFDINDPSLKDLTKYFWAWYYAPLVDIAPALPGIGKIPGVGMIHLNPKDIKIPLFETKGFKYKLNGNNIDVTMDRNMIGQSAENAFTFVTADIKVAGSDFSTMKPKVGDLSYTTTIIMDDHAYDTCAEAQ
ncbi:MAG: hypothetical protein WCX65_17215 [bacterium]